MRRVTIACARGLSYVPTRLFKYSCVGVWDPCDSTKFLASALTRRLRAIDADAFRLLVPQWAYTESMFNPKRDVAFYTAQYKPKDWYRDAPPTNMSRWFIYFDSYEKLARLTPGNTEWLTSIWRLPVEDVKTHLQRDALTMCSRGIDVGPNNIAVAPAHYRVFNPTCPTLPAAKLYREIQNFLDGRTAPPGGTQITRDHAFSFTCTSPHCGLLVERGLLKVTPTGSYILTHMNETVRDIEKCLEERVKQGLMVSLLNGPSRGSTEGYEGVHMTRWLDILRSNTETRTITLFGRLEMHTELRGWGNAYDYMYARLRALRAATSVAGTMCATTELLGPNLDLTVSNWDERKSTNIIKYEEEANAELFSVRLMKRFPQENYRVIALPYGARNYDWVNGVMKKASRKRALLRLGDHIGRCKAVKAVKGPGTKRKRGDRGHLGPRTHNPPHHSKVTLDGGRTGLRDTYGYCTDQFTTPMDHIVLIWNEACNWGHIYTALHLSMKLSLVIVKPPVKLPVKKYPVYKRIN